MLGHPSGWAYGPPSKRPQHLPIRATGCISFKSALTSGFRLFLLVMLLLHFMAASRPFVEQGYHLSPCLISGGRLYRSIAGWEYAKIAASCFSISCYQKSQAAIQQIMTPQESFGE